MFTGIITEIGEVKSLRRSRETVKLTVSCGDLKKGLRLGDSVAVNGVCLSVVDISGSVSFDVVKNTFNKTGLKRLKPGHQVNLENAMKLGDKVSGHIVTGHVDGERPVKNNKNTSKGRMMEIGIFPEDKKYVINRGSISIDGVSLTIAEVNNRSVGVYLIPVTINDTTLKLKKIGDYVNVEFDNMAKIAEKQKVYGMGEDVLRRTGFLD